MTTRPQFSSVEGASGENKCIQTVVHHMWECKSKWPMMLIIYSTTIKGFSFGLLVRVPELATFNLFLLLCTFFLNFDLSHLKEGKYTVIIIDNLNRRCSQLSCFQFVEFLSWSLLHQHPHISTQEWKHPVLITTVCNTTKWQW